MFKLLGNTTRLSFLALVLASHVSAQSNAARDLFEQGVAQNQRYIFVDASVLFTQAIALDQDYAEAYYQRGLSFAGMGQNASAAQDYQTAIRLKIRILDPYLRLIGILKEQNRYRDALAITDQIIANMPENAAGANYDRGQIFEILRQPEAAIAAYQASLHLLDAGNADFATVLKQRIEALQ